LHSAVDSLRRQGIRAGAFRPITLWPFPSQALARATSKAERVLVFELSNGQMVEDVRLTLGDKIPVEFYARVGGNVPSVGEVMDKLSGWTHSAQEQPAGRLSQPCAGTEQKYVDLFAMTS